MLQTTEAITREVIVNTPPDAAFRVFTAEMTAWWPSDHHIGSAPIAEIVIEPQVGGRWFTRHTDGSETDTGRVVAWDPPGGFSVTWQIGADWRYHDDLATTVDVGFHDAGDGRTRVVLTHRDLDAYGEHAAAMHEMFSEPGAWTATLEAFAARAGAA